MGRLRLHDRRRDPPGPLVGRRAAGRGARTMQVDAHSHAEDVIGAGAGDGGEAGALRERCAARAGLIRGVEHEAAPW